MHVPESIEKCLERQEEEQRIEIAQLAEKAKRLYRALGRLFEELDAGEGWPSRVAGCEGVEIDQHLSSILARRESIMILKAVISSQRSRQDSVAQNATNLSKEGVVEGEA